jgi:hypothetical protein
MSDAHSSPARLLRERAESYGRDAGVLRQEGDLDAALIYETVRDELRKCAKECES